MPEATCPMRKTEWIQRKLNIICYYNMKKILCKETIKAFECYINTLYLIPDKKEECY